MLPAAARRQRRLRAARSVQARRARRSSRPLAYARLWHREAPHTSQRRSAQKLGKVTLLLGGNRTGKTELGAQVTVAMALGADHPDVQAWAQLNQIDVRDWPTGPGKVCASALTTADSLRYLRDKLDKYLPGGSTWHNRYGQGEAWVVCPNGAVILCKSNDQGRRSFQGDSWRLVWLDEEHDEPIFDEAQMRLLDQAGRTIMTMTPLKGFTWVYDRWIAAHDEDTAIHYLHMVDNPHLPAAEVEKAIRKMKAHERDARAKGLFIALDGLIYSEWDPHLHVIDAFALPLSWPRYRCIDFGTRAPFACLWLARDPRDDTLYVYREHYEAERTTIEHAGIIASLEEGDPKPEWTAADPEGLDAIRTLQRQCDWDSIRHPGWMKAVKEGINAVKDRLRPDAEGKVHLKVFRGCVNLIREMHGYVWKPGNKEVPNPDCADHALDALRYGEMCLARDLQMAA